jgi:two-component system alkaline phosphatase synthesis response regulator PhoP
MDSAPSSQHIFLVEDEPDISMMYETLLTKAGYTLTVFRDGQEAWEALTSRDRPDLLLLDVVTPRKDGFEVLTDIRKHPKLHDLKVVLLTNLAQEVDRKMGEKLQASDYVVKAHITPHELVDKVKKYLAS